MENMHPKYCILRRGNARRTTFLAALLLLTAAFLFPTQARAETAGDYEYELMPGGGALITKYSGQNHAVVSVPSVLGGEPVESIGKWAFSDIHKNDKDGYEYAVPRYDIREIYLPLSLRRIENQAFESLDALQEIHVPASVVHLGEAAFLSCSALSSVELPDSLEVIPAGCFENCGLRTVRIPEGVVSIGDAAFAQNYELTSCRLPSTLEAVGAGAFGSCPRLETVLLPSRTTQIGTAAFAGSGLTSFSIPDGAAEVPAGLFMGCTSLRHVDIPGSVLTIDQYAFDECSALDTVSYAGTPSEWDDILITAEGNASLYEAEITFLQEDPGEEGDLPGGIFLREGTQVEVLEIRSTYFLGGYTATSESRALTTAELGRQFVLPEGTRIAVFRNGEKLSNADIVGTGCAVLFLHGTDTVLEATCVVRGDVLGTGVMSLSQLVRMADAYRDPGLLTGPYLAAADLSGTGSVTLSDLVLESKLFHESVAV